MENDDDWGDWEDSWDDEEEAAAKPKSKSKPKPKKPAAKTASSKKPAAKKPTSRRSASASKPASSKTPAAKKPATKTSSGPLVEIVSFKASTDAGQVICIPKKTPEGEDQAFNKAHFKKGALKGLLSYDFKLAAYVCPTSSVKELRVGLKEAGYKLTSVKAPEAKPKPAAKKPVASKKAPAKASASVEALKPVAKAAAVKLMDRKAYNKLRDALRDNLVMLEGRFSEEVAQNTLEYILSRPGASMADVFEKRR